MLKTQPDRILTWFASPVSHGVAEGFNNRIPSTRSVARGFRMCEHHRIRILFCCGKRGLKPSENRPRKSPEEPVFGVALVKSHRLQKKNSEISSIRKLGEHLSESGFGLIS